MAKKLPVDFEKKVKHPPGVDGKGYPYQLSAKDLMLNFNALLKLLPDGKTGDMLYHDGTEWVLLDNPGLPGTGDTNQLTHDGTSPVWATESATGGSGDHPFKITAETGTYTISSGSITDGTNGDAIDLAGIIETSHAASSGYVVISASVDSSLVVTSWGVAIEVIGDTDEVLMTTSPPIEQESIRLVIGKLAVSGDTITVSQALFTSVRITYGLINGVAVKVFEAAPTHAGDL